MVTNRGEGEFMVQIVKPGLLSRSGGVAALAYEMMLAMLPALAPGEQWLTAEPVNILLSVMLSLKRH
jgi:hypothetical protein